MTTEELPLSQRAYNSAAMMYDSDRRGPAPRLEDFAGLDAAPAAAVAPVDPEPAPAATPATSAGWDAAAFDRLPVETRAGVMAGTARGLARNMLELEAEGELVRPVDVHLHITDPSKYVGSDGRVDRDAIRRDLAALVSERPELSRYGHGPGQEPYRPDERRHAAPGGLVGAGGGPTSTLDARVQAAAEMMKEDRW